MLDKLGGYRTALYLSIVVALANCALWGIVLPYRARIPLAPLYGASFRC